MAGHLCHRIIATSTLSRQHGPQSAADCCYERCTRRLWQPGAKHGNLIESARGCGTSAKSPLCSVSGPVVGSRTMGGGEGVSGTASSWCSVGGSGVGSTAMEEVSARTGLVCVAAPLFRPRAAWSKRAQKGSSVCNILDQEQSPGEH
jgi:hypothetical protein